LEEWKFLLIIITVTTVINCIAAHSRGASWCTK